MLSLSSCLSTTPPHTTTGRLTSLPPSAYLPAHTPASPLAAPSSPPLLSPLRSLSRPIFRPRLLLSTVRPRTPLASPHPPLPPRPLSDDAPHTFAYSPRPRSTLGRSGNLTRGGDEALRTLPLILGPSSARGCMLGWPTAGVPFRSLSLVLLDCRCLLRERATAAPASSSLRSAHHWAFIGTRRPACPSALSPLTSSTVTAP